MIRGLGTDIIEIDRVKQATEKTPRFLEKLFTDRERAYFARRKMRMETIAGSFAAKEALSKALGTGIGKIGFLDIEILRQESGQPKIVLSDKARRTLNLGEKDGFMLSISHCKAYAVATVIHENKGGNNHE